MAWFSFKCPDHGKFKISLCKRQKTHPCPQCRKESKNTVKIGYSNVVEEIDTGSMPRKVEWQKDIQEIIEERDRKFK